MSHEDELAAGEDRDPGEIVLDRTIDVGDRRWRRLMIKTRVVHPGDDITGVIVKYSRPHLQPGDVVFISEKCTAIAQERLVRVDDVRPGFWARFLAARIKKTPAGIGLGMAETMQLAIEEAGIVRMLAAAGAGALGKLLGRSGDFYRVAGPRAKSIDGPTDWVQPPFNDHIVLAPEDPDGVAEEAAAALSAALERRLAGEPAAGEETDEGPSSGQGAGVAGEGGTARDEMAAARQETAGAGGQAVSGATLGVAVVDVNDLGSQVLGASQGVDRRLVGQALRDNPLGQGAYQTPLGILRPAQE